MARILVPSSDEHRRFAVMLTIARGLAARGHEVVMLTSMASRPVVRAAGLGALTVPFVDADADEARPRALAKALATPGYDVVLADTVLVGAVPTGTGMRGGRRPALLGVTTEPWVRGRADAALTVGESGPFDLVFRLTPTGLEAPRRRSRPDVRFLGSLKPGPQRRTSPPTWWGDVEETRPVVHVTQGPAGGLDLGRLVVPALRALAGEPVLVVATTGALPVSALYEQYRGPLPANVRVTGWLPDDQLMPHLAAMVTDGEPDGVVAALRHGVPLVVAGSGAPFNIGKSVARAGAGFHLRVGSQRPVVIRRAVQRVLADDRHWHAARRLQAELRRLQDPLDVMHSVIDELAPGPRPARRTSPPWSPRPSDPRTPAVLTTTVCV